MAKKTVKGDKGEKSQLEIWKKELDELKAQRSNKAITPTVLVLIDKEIPIIENKIARYATVTTELKEVEEKIAKYVEILSKLRQEQKEHQIFLGVTSAPASTKRSKFNADEVIAFIKKSADKVSYKEISKFTKIGVQTIKPILSNDTRFVINVSTRPHLITLK